MINALLFASLQAAAAAAPVGLPADVSAKIEANLEADRAAHPKKLARAIAVEDHWFMVRVRYQEGIAEANHMNMCSSAGLCFPPPAILDDRYVRLALASVERVGGCKATLDRMEKTRVFAKLDCTHHVQWSEANPAPLAPSGQTAMEATDDGQEIHDTRTWHIGQNFSMTPQQAAIARQALDDKLLDYPSARFRYFHIVKKGGNLALCGEMNGRTRGGGYTGWQRTAIMIEGDVLDRDHTKHDKPEFFVYGDDLTHIHEFFALCPSDQDKGNLKNLIGMADVTDQITFR